MTFVLPPQLEPLTEYPRWAVWKPTTRAGRTGFAKAPSSPRTGRHLKTTEPDTWFTYGECVHRIVDLAEAEKRTTPGFDPVWNTRGIGFLLGHGMRLVVIDIDFKNLTPDDPNRAWALGVYNRLDTFAETSPSGKGCHVFGVVSDRAVYDRIGSSRPVRGCIDLLAQTFVTVTGNVCRDQPIADITEPLRTLLDEEGIYAPAPSVSERRKVGNMTLAEAYAAAQRLDKGAMLRLEKVVPPGRGAYNANVFAIAATLAKVGATEDQAFDLIVRSTLTVRSPPSAKGEDREEKLRRILPGIWDKVSRVDNTGGGDMS